jgi:hypothetical protein
VLVMKISCARIDMHRRMHRDSLASSVAQPCAEAHRKISRNFQEPFLNVRIPMRRLLFDE